MREPGTATPASLAAVAELGSPTAEERDIGGRILAAVRILASREGVAPAHGPTAALRLASAAARHAEPRVAGLTAVEVAAAAMAAPWPPDDDARAVATWTGMRVVERLLPGAADGELGRDTGTWGAIGAAVAIDGLRGLDRAETVASLAAALALEPVAGAGAGHGYLATRAGHAASVALLAVALADAGLVDDPLALATLDGRLGLGPRGEAVVRGGRLARLAVELLERSVA